MDFFNVRTFDKKQKKNRRSIHVLLQATPTVFGILQ